MRKIYILFLILFVSASSLRSQVVQLNEVFTSPATLSGWSIQNKSNPIGPDTWAQGIGTVFPAYSGAQNDYYYANLNSMGTTFGNISNFLITPTVSLMNGGILKFATRVQANPTTFPDHLEVRMSYGVGTGAIPNNDFSVGTFTVTLTDINPALTSTGYPGTWTVYTKTLTGITGTLAGRFAFRYQVFDGGPNGTNSDYIGLDDVNYTTAPPCPAAPVVISPNTTTICAGGSVTLVATGATNYTWSTTSNSSSIAVSPGSTTIYTLTGTNPTGCPGVTTATVTIGPPPVVSVSNVTACPGSFASIIASGASTYTWSNGSTASSITVVANTSTVFTVTGFNGPTCSDTKTVSLTTNTFLTVSNATVTACPSQPTILGAGGASTYTWNTGATTPSIVITPTANGTYTVTGSNAGCNESKIVNVVIDPNLFAPSFTTCAGTAATLIAMGATTYSWNTGATSAMIIVTPTANTVYTITGTSGACSQSKTVSVTLGTNLSVNCTQTCVGTSLLLSAYGASSYTWQPINDFNASVIVTPTATTIYTLTGKSGTCTGSKTILVTFCAGVDEHTLMNESIRVYPNPFKDEITIKDAYGDVILMNMVGQVILNAKVEEKLVISTEALTPGIYFLIINNSKTIERKIIKVIKN